MLESLSTLDEAVAMLLEQAAFIDLLLEQCSATLLVVSHDDGWCATSRGTRASGTSVHGQLREGRFFDSRSQAPGAGAARSLTALSVALSVAMLLGVEHLRSAPRTSFEQSVSGVDVGARTSPVQLLLHSVFRLGGGV